ncbi:MAG: hypothetical protein JWP29_4912 [Rhodoferax sp.]|nr:hypothetical protein [Rhodoferax sp.]
MHTTFLKLAAALAAAVVTANAFAQTDGAAIAVQQAYERAVAACNSGNLPAPARDGCVRAAGTALDRARGGPPVGVPLTTPDGRATVIAPEVASAPLGDRPPVSVGPAEGSEGVGTSSDGRATVVKP